MKFDCTANNEIKIILYIDNLCIFDGMVGLSQFDPLEIFDRVARPKVNGQIAANLNLILLLGMAST